MGNMRSKFSGYHGKPVKSPFIQCWKNVHSSHCFSTSKSLGFRGLFSNRVPRATSSLPGLPGRRTTTRQRDPWTSEIFLALRYELGAHGFKQVYNISHDGSMVLLYMVLHESHQQKTLCVSINIPAPWIRHGYIYTYIYIYYYH